jgi:alanine dehydrogenase
VAPLLFDDDHVRARLDAVTAVNAIRAALVAHHSGALQAPARVRADLENTRLVFTAGAAQDQGVFGFRAYDTAIGAEQLVAVWDSTTGELRALVHGDELGIRRTGAIGAVATDAAARPGPLHVGLIGSGRQAWAQLWALCAIRPVEQVVVASRRKEHADTFTERSIRELGVPARAAATAEEAVREQDVVIVATDSATPVLEVGWISAGTHVTTLGPKTISRHEVPPALADRADTILTDSRAQAAGYGERHVFPPDQMVELGAVLAGDAVARSGPDQITVFCSVGLAGTEVTAAAALLRATSR